MIGFEERLDENPDKEVEEIKEGCEVSKASVGTWERASKRARGKGDEMRS
jgi:hypothetical protein